MIETINKIEWYMLVVGTNGNKKIVVPAIEKKDGKKEFVYEEGRQIFEDLQGEQYAFACDLRTKNSLEYYDRDGNIMKDILDYPEILKKNGLSHKDMVPFSTIRRLQNELNALVEDEYEKL